MMNKIKISIALVALLGLMPAAIADVYVKVDASGNAIGGAIICDAATCGSDSLYSKLTLQPGESYQLQGTGQAGIGNNNPGVEVKVDIPTQTWTVTNNNTPAPSVRTFTSEQGPSPVYAEPIRVETSTAISDTATVISETATTLSDTATATVDTATVTIADLDAKILELRTLIARIEALLARFYRW
jgi:hypothetical protein